MIQIYIKRWIYHQHTSRVWWSYNVFFLLLDPLDRREHKPVFLFLEIMYCTFGRIPHWYHSKCRLMSGNLFKHFLSIQKLSRHHAESVSDSVQIASIKSESFWERKWVEQMHEINGFAWFWYIFWGHGWVWSHCLFYPPSQGKRFIYSNFVEVWSIHIYNRSQDR